MMKPVAIITAAALLAWLGWELSAPLELSFASLGTAASQAEPPTQVLTDNTAIFRQAFWKNPGPEDQILHAERREWSAADGLKKWQWFIVVKPSPLLAKYLREDNAFSLVQSEAVGIPNDAPSWFRHDADKIDLHLKSPMGGMSLAFSDDLLYATDSGDGFRPGLPEAPAASFTPTVHAGRLPASPPPTPEAPPPTAP